MSVLASDFITQKDKLEDYFAELESHSLDLALIIQGKSESSLGRLDNMSGKIIWSADIGLSKSRNLALNQCKTRFLICSDWDTRYSVSSLLELSSKINTIADHIPFIRFGVLRADNFENAYQVLLSQENSENITIENKNSSLGLTSIASVQICWNMNFIHKYGLQFDETLGLGNKSILPSFGEEYLLALQCLAITDSYGETTEVFGVTHGKSTGIKSSKVERVLLAFYCFLQLSKTSPAKSTKIVFQRLKRILLRFVKPG